MPPPTARAAAVEADFRRLLAENHLPAPDDVRYDPGEVVFVFRERKLAVIVDYDEDAGPNDPLTAARPLNGSRPLGPSDPLTAAREPARPAGPGGGPRTRPRRPSTPSPRRAEPA
jgi:hypothetical protein